MDTLSTTPQNWTSIFPIFGASKHNHSHCQCDIGGKGNQKLEFWEWDDNKKEFNISESTHLTTDWYKYPECFLVEKDQFSNI